jgi:glycosyltransferase involved in cell wall biosynthesis
VRLIQNLSSSLPGIFLSVPFFSTLNHMYMGRRLVGELDALYGPERPAEAKKVLWFTDTLTDLNGVSMTLREIARTGQAAGMDLKIVACLGDGPGKLTVPNVVNLPANFEFRIPSYESYTLRVPALLRTLDIIQREEPEMVIISTPGPLGLLGLLVARIFSVRSVGVYHTDFALQAKAIIKDESIVGLLESYTRWFYTAVDEVRVPTREYVRILSERGLDPAKMKVFGRGLDTDRFAPRDDGWPDLANRWGVRDGINLLYVGRISEDKNLDFLIEVYKAAAKPLPGLNLIIVGDGPYLEALKAKAGALPRVVFTGRLSYDELPRVYSQADLFVFPSTTDTFGMAVLEAQACGLPALVSDAGGPQELVVHGRTGWVVPTGRIMDWRDEIEQFVRLARTKPDKLAAIKAEARARAVRNADWRSLLRELFDEARFIKADTDAGRRQDAAPFDPARTAENRPSAVPAPVTLKGGTLNPALGLR